MFANVSLLASAAAGPSWNLYRQQPVDARVRYTTSDKGSDQRTQVVQHAALNCLSNPAAVQAGDIRLPAFTRFSLMELSGVFMETTGKSHWIIDRGPDDISPVPLGLWPVRPDRMTPVPSRDNWLAGWIYTSPDGQEKIPQAVVGHCLARSRAQREDLGEHERVSVAERQEIVGRGVAAGFVGDRPPG